MQELLGRLMALDPEASHGLRVIACFDELVVGGVGTRALLSAAAALAGRPAGFHQDDPVRCVRVDARGRLLPPAPPPPGVRRTDGQAVWLDGEAASGPHDDLVLERLALALRIRHGRGPARRDDRRDLAVVLDADCPPEVRREAAGRCGIRSGSSHRVVVAPLFAHWQEHPAGPEDVVPTAFGPLHVLVVPAGADAVAARPSGTSAPCAPEDLPRGLRAATTALRLWDPSCGPTSPAERYGGLLDLLVDLPEETAGPDVDRLAAITAHPWGSATVEALVLATSVRHAARIADVHHSTMRSRLDEVVRELGYDPLVDYGRARLGVAWLRWRLRGSRVLDLPAPSARQVAGWTPADCARVAVPPHGRRHEDGRSSADNAVAGS